MEDLKAKLEKMKLKFLKSMSKIKGLESISIASDGKEIAKFEFENKPQNNKDNATN